MADVAIWVLRVALGIVIVPHGVHKLQNIRAIGKKWQRHYGFPQGSVLLAGAAQVACGLAMAAGIFPRLAALVLVLVMLAATYVSIWKEREPFLSTPEGKGWDVNFLLIAALLASLL